MQVPLFVSLSLVLFLYFSRSLCFFLFIFSLCFSLPLSVGLSLTRTSVLVPLCNVPLVVGVVSYALSSSPAFCMYDV